MKNRLIATVDILQTPWANLTRNNVPDELKPVFDTAADCVLTKDRQPDMRYIKGKRARSAMNTLDKWAQETWNAGIPFDEE